MATSPQDARDGGKPEDASGDEGSKSEPKSEPKSDSKSASKPAVRIPPPPVVGRTRAPSGPSKVVPPKKASDAPASAADVVEAPTPGAPQGAAEAQTAPVPVPPSASSSGAMRPGDSKPQMPSLAVGPQVMRAGENNELVLTTLEGDPPAAEDAGDEVAEVADDGSEASGRLPRPGMLRDDAGLSVKEFRQARKGKHAPPPPPDAGVLPEGGVAPPAVGVPKPTPPEDTDVLIASVADELIGPLGEPEPEPESPKAAPATEAPVSVPPPATTEPANPAETEPAASSAGVRTLPADEPAPPSTRRLLVAAALLLLVGAIAWAVQGNENRDPKGDVVAKGGLEARPADSRQEQAPADPAGRDDGDGGDDDGDDGDDGAEPVPAGASSTGAGDEAMVILDTGAALDEATGESDATDGVYDTDGALAGDPDEDTDDGADDGADDASAAASTHSGQRRKKKKKKPASREPDPVPTSSSNTAPPKSAKELLDEARKAYSQGNGKKAYSLAKQSNNLRPTTAAVETMALASCQRKDEATARRLVKKLPLTRRGSVRDRCRTFGVRIGI